MASNASTAAMRMVLKMCFMVNLPSCKLSYAIIESQVCRWCRGRFCVRYVNANSHFSNLRQFAENSLGRECVPLP